MFKWSGKPGSNRRPQPWQGCALPTELFPQIFYLDALVNAFEPPRFIGDLELAASFRGAYCKFKSFDVKSLRIFNFFDR
jgi:hypothetical protein